MNVSIHRVSPNHYLCINSLNLREIRQNQRLDHTVHAPIRNTTVQRVISPSNLHKDPSPSHSMAETPWSVDLLLPQWPPDSRRLSGRSRPVRSDDYSGPHPCRICSEPEEVRASPHTRLGVHMGEVLHGPGQTIHVPTRDTDPGSDRLCKVLLQSRGIQTSTPISESEGADGSYDVVGGICLPPHATHPVVPEAVFDPYNPWVASPNLC